MVIQQVYFEKEKYSIYIKGIIPDEDSSHGEIIINGNPTKLERRERYRIENGMVYTDNYKIPINYVINFLSANGSTVEKDGQTFVVFKEITFNKD